MFDRKAFFEYAFGMAVTEMPSSAVITPFFPKKFFLNASDSTKTVHGKIFHTTLLRRGSRSIALLRLGKAAYLAGDAIIGLEPTAVKRVLFLNSCASLRADDIGQIIVPKGSFAAEEFSGFHFSKASKKSLIEDARLVTADKDLGGKVASFLETFLAPKTIKRGNNFTTGSVTSEDSEMVDLLRAKNIITMDMELSKILTGAKVSGFAAASVMVVSDSFKGKKFFQSFTKKQRSFYNRSCAQTCRTVLGFLEQNEKG